MNERIKELEKLATPRCYDETGCYIGNRFDPEKFAELIVRECMNVVCDPRTTYLESMTESSAMYTARERIRKHFGG
jgi:hypothetical protein